MFLMDSFFSRISGDFRQKELLPLKLLFFIHTSTMYVLYPYLTIHMRELGINVEETAIMSAVTPVVAIIMPPLAGIVADRIGNFKIILSLLSGLGGAASLLLLLVPVGRINVSFPNNTMLEVNTSHGLIDLTLAELNPCNRYSNDSLTVNLRMEGCGLVCNRKVEDFSPYEQGPKTVDEENIAILGTRNYTVIVKSSNGTDTYQYILGPGDLPLYTTPTDLDVRETRVMSNKGHFSTSVRELAPSRYFFPATGLSSFDCTAENEIITCSINIKDDQVPQEIVPEPKFFAIKLNNSLESHFYIYNVKPDIDNVTSWKFFQTNGGDTVSEKTLSIDIPLPNVDNGLEIDATLRLENCVPRCLATIPRASLCSNKEKVTEFDVRFTFWLYLVIRVFIGMISGTAFAMFEGAVIAILREHKADYGLQRIYATIGGMISSPLSGWLIDYASKDKNYTDFRPAFYLYAAMKMLSSVLMLTINLEFKSPSKNVLEDVLAVLRKVEIIALLITCFILGTAWGYIENFLFWFLQDLGASRSLMGITITVGGVAGLPLLVMSGPIIDKIGHANVLFIGFIFYAIRLMGYSLIYNPWMCLIFEAMESVTSSLAFTAAVTYAAKLSSMTTDSSIQGLLGGLYFGVGKGAGSLVGGYLMEAVGTRPTYQIFSAVTLLTGIIYFLFNHFLISRHTEEHKEKKKMKEANGAITVKEIPTKQQEAENIPMSTEINQKNKYNSNNLDETKNEDGTINKAFDLSDEANSFSEKR